jgi:rhomboid protease GluP
MTASPRQSLLCPRCRKLISTSEPACPYCGISHPASWWRQTAALSRHLQPDHIVRTLITANIILFVLSILLNPAALQLSMNPFALFSPSNQMLLLLGATGTIPIDQFHRWWSLLSAGYLHGGILHIFFNMMVLNQLAPFILQEYGMNRMISIYTLGSIAGFYVSYRAGVPFTIGASAGLFALIGAILYYARSRGGAYGQMLLKNIGGWVIGLFIFGFIFPGINNWAHGGGLAGGIALAFVLGYEERKRETAFHRTLAHCCVAATLLILGWAVVSALYLRFSAY